MTEPTVRVLVVAIVVATALAVAVAARRGVAVRRRSVRMSLPFNGVVLFASEGCATCQRALSRLSEAGVEDVTVVDWDRSPEIFLSAGIDRVPTLVSVDPTGSGWMVQGTPSATRLRKWLGGP